MEGARFMYVLGYQDIALRLAAAVISGGLIGFERERKGRDAGFRTHILVAVGSCIFALIELEAAFSMISLASYSEAARQVIAFDVHRLTAQVVSGIGFLGAGTIIITKRSIKGLTTAASIWVCAALGIASGFGYFNLVIAGTLVIMLTLLVVKRLFFFPKVKRLSIRYVGQEHLLKEITGFLHTKRVKIMEIDSDVFIENGEVNHHINFNVDSRLIASLDEFLQEISALGTLQELSLRDLGDEYL